MGFLYLLTFSNGKAYIGITSGTVKRRLVLHRYHARSGRKGALQAAIRKYGDFEVKVLVEAEWDYLVELEVAAISAFETRYPNGYNLTDGGEGTVGRRVTETEREASRQRNLRKIADGTFHLKPPAGYTHSAETRAKMSRSRMGREFSEETRKKIGLTKVGNTYGVGRQCPPEVRLKISLAQKGKPRQGKPWSVDRRQKFEEKIRARDTAS